MAVVREAAASGNVVVLGANVARQCLDVALLDEIIVHVAPLLVGDGVRLYEHLGPPVKLAPVASRREGDTTVLHYTVHYPA